MATLEGLDLGTKFWFENHWRPWSDNLMIDITALGSTTVLTLVTLFAFGLLLSLRRYRTACFVLAAVVLGGLMMEGIKKAVGRERPEITHPLLVNPPRSPSFPSGHAMVSSVVYLSLALVAAPHLPRRRIRAYVIGCALGLVFLIGVSRIYLGVHYLTDVVAAWAGGLTWALACRIVEDRWTPLRQEEEASAAEVKTVNAD